jgi:hypothetical protein
MPSFNDYKDILEIICKEWDLAEKYIKEAEQVANNVVFPSIKELRYAGRRIVDGLNLIVKDGEKEKNISIFQGCML